MTKADDLVRTVRELLDGQEATLRRALAVGLDPTQALEDVAALRQLLDLGGAAVAAAFLHTRSLDRAREKLCELPDLASRGGSARVAKHQQAVATLLAAARRECPDLLAKSARAAAKYLVKRRLTTWSTDRTRKILSQHK